MDESGLQALRHSDRLFWAKLKYNSQKKIDHYRLTRYVKMLVNLTEKNPCISY